MKLFKRLLVHAIALLALNCCLADSGPTKHTVSVNDHVLQITLPGEGAAPSVVQRLIAERVRRAIIDLTVQKSNITVSQETLSRCMDLYVVAGGESPTNIVDVVAARSAITIEALRKVVVNHEDKNDVYDKYLSRVMPHSEWETWLSSNNSIGKIDKLESLVPHSVNDLKRFSQESLRRDIEVWLLFHKLTKEVKPSPEEIQSYYKEKYPAGTPSFSEVKSEIENDIGAFETVSGRGLLGHWGPNHAGDPVVTRWAKNRSIGNSKVLEVVLINRKDSGELALPGGMVDAG